MGRFIALLAAAMVAACASTADVDTSKAEPACAQQCVANHQKCIGEFGLFPIYQQNNCVSTLKLCVNACPARK